MFEKIQRLIKLVLKQEYAKAGIYYVIANIIGQGIVLFSSAIFTRMMSKADYGLVSTYSTWVLVLNTFICMNLFVSVRTAYIDFKDNYDNYNSSVLLLAILSGILMMAVIVGITRLHNCGFGVWEMLLACIQSVALNIVNYMLAIQSMKNEYKQRFFLMIAPNWTHIILSVVLMMVFTGNLYMAKIAGNAFGLLVFGIGCAVMLFRKAAPKLISGYWKYALKISVPSVFNTLSDLILMQCDRLMLTAMVGSEETAEYSVVYNVSSVVVAIYQAVNGAWLPWFFNEIEKKNKEKIRKYLEFYMLIFMVFSCGMMTISPELIKIMSPPNYWRGISYVSPIVAASYLIFLYAFFSAYLLYKKRTVRIAVNTVAAAMLNLVLNRVLIPDYKAVGAVMATVVSYTALFFLHFYAVKKTERQYFSIAKMGLSLIGIAAYGTVFYFIRDICFIRYVLYLAVVVMLYLLFGKKMLIEFMEKEK